MKQSFVDKITEILNKVPIVKNLARKKFISQFAIGLIKSRNVQFYAVAQHLNDSAKLKSNEVRIQDFFREVDLDYAMVAILLLSLLPSNRKLRLCIDRTNWKFGCHKYNILMVTVGCDDLTLPLYWEMLSNKGGNSSGKQRTDLLEKCIQLIGVKRIGLVIGDREFIGHHWLKYMKTRHIKFIMRMPKHHNIHRSDGRVQTIKEWQLTTKKTLFVPNVLMDGVVGNLSVQKLENGDYLFLFGTVVSEFMEQLYRKRWKIEVLFQNFKGRGFELEKTHLKSDKKLKMMVALVGITYGLIESLGIFHHKKIKDIKYKNHGYKAQSFARTGIDLIQEWTRPGNVIPEFIQSKARVFIRYLEKKVIEYQLIKIAG